MSIKINVDAGHGSATSGKRTPDGYREHWINVMTAGFLEAALRRCGFDVMMTGFDDADATDDPDVSISNRQKAVKAGGCKASVSCHANAAGSGGWSSAEGITTYIHSDATKAKNSLALAKVVQAELVKGTSQRDRGIGKGNLGMCNAYYMGCDYAILVEIGFMTNKNEADLMKTEAFCKEQGEDICRGICKFYNVPYVGSLTDQDSNKTIKASTAAKSKDISLKGTYVCTSKTTLKLRDSAGTDDTKNPVLAKIKSGETVKCYGYYTVVDEIRFLYVTYNLENVTFTGFASDQYLKIQ